MQPVTQTEMFEQRVLQVTPENLTCGGCCCCCLVLSLHRIGDTSLIAGYNCFKVFFENVNMSAGKMRRSGMDIPVSNMQSV